MAKSDSKRCPWSQIPMLELPGPETDSWVTPITRPLIWKYNGRATLQPHQHWPPHLPSIFTTKHPFCHILLHTSTSPCAERSCRSNWGHLLTTLLSHLFSLMRDIENDKLWLAQGYQQRHHSELIHSQTNGQCEWLGPQALEPEHLG